MISRVFTTLLISRSSLLGLCSGGEITKYVFTMAQSVMVCVASAIASLSGDLS